MRDFYIELPMIIVWHKGCLCYLNLSGNKDVMKKGIFCLMIFFMFLSVNAVFAFEARRDYFSKPQLGLWFGPVTPVGVTAESLETNLGGGIFFRYNLPWKYLKFGLDASYQFFEQEEGVNKMHLVPLYGSMIFLLPIDMPLKFQVKAGAGSGYIHVQPDDKSRWDPIFVFGGELSFPAGRFVNIGLRIDYINLYEKHLEGSEVNGHVINSGIAVYFNLDL